QAIAIEADSADPRAIQAAVDKTLRHYGRLDVAVVNAGVLRLGTLEAYSLDDLDTTLAVNVRGVFLAIQAAVKPMAEGGRVIT
ncbi:SDR family oxidoreductase, partial [Klebsiella pneumoniae]